MSKPARLGNLTAVPLSRILKGGAGEKFTFLLFFTFFYFFYFFFTFFYFLLFTYFFAYCFYFFLLFGTYAKNGPAVAETIA